MSWITAVSHALMGAPRYLRSDEPCSRDPLVCASSSDEIPFEERAEGLSADLAYLAGGNKAWELGVTWTCEDSGNDSYVARVVNSLPSKPWGDWVSSFFQNVDYVPAGDSNILQIELIGESSCVTVQRTPEPSPTADTDQDDGADSDDGPPVTMSVIKLDGESYPIEQMLPHGSVNGDCLDEHFHTPNGAIPTNPDAAPIADPRPGGCGIGTYDDIVDIEVSQSDWLVFQDRAVAARDGGSGSSQSGDTTETIGVDVVVVNGERFPIEQFDAPTRDACDNKEHYHSSLPSFSLEGGTLADPDPDGCGYATVDEVIHVQVPAEEWNRYRSLLAGT